MSPHPFAPEAPEPYIEDAALVEVPPVPVQVVTEDDLRCVGVPDVALDLLRRQCDLRLHASHRGLRAGSDAQGSGHRAEVTPGADQDRGLEAFVHDPPRSFPTKGGHLGSVPDVGAAAFGQELVELGSHYAVAHGPAVGDLVLGAPAVPDHEALEGREDPAVASVLCRIDLQ